MLTGRVQTIRVPRRLGELVAISPLWRSRIENAARIRATEIGDGPPGPARLAPQPAAAEDSATGPSAEPSAALAGVSSAHCPPPDLSNIRPADFEDTGRALELFRQAVARRLMPNDSEDSRLVWLAAIERARTVPARNPAGVLIFVVRNRRWDFLSERHFETANARLKSFLYARPHDAEPFLVARAGHHATVAAPALVGLSKDAQLVKLLQSRLGGRGRVLAALHGRAGWIRERHAAAVAEIEAASIRPG